MVAAHDNPESASPARASARESDQRVRMHGLRWADYEAILAMRGEASVPRIAYLEGELELMSPSREHEKITWTIGYLLLAYAAERGIDLWPAGAWTVRDESTERGIEADACFTVGDPQHAERPALAVEVIWTSGGLDKLAIYRALAVPEVWFWRADTIEVFVLGADGYASSPSSPFLPGLDVALIARLARLGPTEGLTQLRAAIRT